MTFPGRSPQMALGEPSGVVVHVGCGFGESLKLWRRRFGTAMVLGVNYSAAEVRGISRAFAVSWT